MFMGAVRGCRHKRIMEALRQRRERVDGHQCKSSLEEALRHEMTKARREAALRVSEQELASEDLGSLAQRLANMFMMPSVDLGRPMCGLPQDLDVDMSHGSGTSARRSGTTKRGVRVFFSVPVTSGAVACDLLEMELGDLEEASLDKRLERVVFVYESDKPSRDAIAAFCEAKDKALKALVERANAKIAKHDENLLLFFSDALAAAKGRAEERRALVEGLPYEVDE